MLKMWCAVVGKSGYGFIFLFITLNYGQDFQMGPKTGKVDTKV